LFTDNLRRMAVIIGEQAFPQTRSEDKALLRPHEELGESYIIQVWDNKGKLVRNSTPEVDLPLQSGSGLSAEKIGGRIWQIYTLRAGKSGFVQIAQPKKIVDTMVAESAARALAPFFLLFALLALGGWYIVGRNLAPLTALSDAITGWEADKMQPLPENEAPQEVQPIITALNSLLAKLGKAMELQRQFTADAAHELRTPLTAIKLQLDVLKRAQTTEAREDAQHKLAEGIDRCIHLATQLLAASRSMSVKSAPDFQSLDFKELVRSSLAGFADLATDKDIELSFAANDDYRIMGDEEGLRALVGNLVDNAMRYTPQGGKIDVRLSGKDGKPILEVADTGPGILQNQQSRIFERFYRIPGTTSTGSGLGLSIVKNVAESHGANVELVHARDKGAVFRVTFPPAKA